MLILANLKPTRQAKGFQPGHIADVADIGRDRYDRLELRTPRTRRKPASPWFDEALVLARILNVAGIANLMVDTGDWRHCEIGDPMPTLDLDLWRSGKRLDLATACRIAILFGLDDPIMLSDPAHLVKAELWRIIASGERLHPLQNHGCPWCAADIVGGAAHERTCLPNNLLGDRAPWVAPNVVVGCVVQRSNAGTASSHGAAGIARGLRKLRESRGWTQAEMGGVIGASADYYSKMERGNAKLTVANAALFANTFGVLPEHIYADPALLADPIGDARDEDILSGDLTDAGVLP